MRPKHSVLIWDQAAFSCSSFSSILGEWCGHVVVKATGLKGRCVSCLKCAIRFSPVIFSCFFMKAMYTARVSFLLLGLAVAAPVTHVNLTTLNRTCEGRLHEATPLARPCFTELNGIHVFADHAQCFQIKDHYSSGKFRSDRYNGFMQDYGETCASSDNKLYAQCLLDPSNPVTSAAALGNSSCGQGSVSQHYIEISNADDVKAAFAYAYDRNQSLSIKNNGHDYLARSSLRGSLALWTRKLQNKSYHGNFVPEACLPAWEPYYICCNKNGRRGEFRSSVQVRPPQQRHICRWVFTHGWRFWWLRHGGRPWSSFCAVRFGHRQGAGVQNCDAGRYFTHGQRLPTFRSFLGAAWWWWRNVWVVLETTSMVEPQMDLIFALIQLPTNVSDTRPFTQILMNNVIRWSREG